MDRRLNVIIRDASSLENRYDPENDTAPDVPVVNYADYGLLQMIVKLVMVIDHMQSQIDELKEALK